jgi:hypothetical protein
MNSTACHVLHSPPTLAKVLNDYLLTRPLLDITRRGYLAAMRPDLDDWLKLPIDSITEKMILERKQTIRDLWQLHLSLERQGMSSYQATKAMGRARRPSHTDTIGMLRALFNFAILQYDDALGRPLVSSNPVNGKDAQRLRMVARRETPCPHCKRSG